MARRKSPVLARPERPRAAPRRRRCRPGPVPGPRHRPPAPPVGCCGGQGGDRSRLGLPSGSAPVPGPRVSGVHGTWHAGRRPPRPASPTCTWHVADSGCRQPRRQQLSSPGPGRRSGVAGRVDGRRRRSGVEQEHHLVAPAAGRGDAPADGWRQSGCGTAARTTDRAGDRGPFVHHVVQGGQQYDQARAHRRPRPRPGAAPPAGRVCPQRVACAAAAGRVTTGPARHRLGGARSLGRGTADAEHRALDRAQPPRPRPPGPPPAARPGRLPRP